MIENINDNIRLVGDTKSPEKGVDCYGVEIVKTSEDADAVKSVQQLGSSLMHDTAVTAGQVLETERALDSMKVIVGDEEMTIAEMKEIPDLEMNATIWKEIESGIFNNVRDLTYLTPRAAKFLIRYGGTIGLWFHSLTLISDSAAEQLSEYPGEIYLSHLTSISDITAERLSKHQGGDLKLDGLTSLSDIAAEHLSKHQGDLYLDGIADLSDIAANHFAQNNRWATYVGRLSRAAAKINSFRKPKS